MTALACDMGGTRIKVGIVRGGEVVHDQVLVAHSERTFRERLKAVELIWREMLTSVRLKVDDCDGIAMSFPSIIDVRSARVLTDFGKYADAPSIDLRRWAREALGLPLAIENDARMALVGEWQHGAARGWGNVVMITLGTGIGTAVVMEGRLVRGAHGQAGCLGGHFTVRHGGRACACGNVGCAEAEASTVCLEAMASEHADFASSALASEPVIDYAAILREAQAGDRCAQAILEHSLNVWSALAVNLIHAYDPEMLVLGGAIMGSADLILPHIRAYVGRHANTPWGKVRIVKSELRDHAALLAAEWLLRERLGAGGD